MKIRSWVVAVCCTLGVAWNVAQAGVFIGVGVPGPYYPRRYYAPRVVVTVPPVVVAPGVAPVYYAPPPPPVYYAPAPQPVYIQQPPVQAPVMQAAYPAATMQAVPPPAPGLPPQPVPVGR